MSSSEIWYRVEFKRCGRTCWQHFMYRGNARTFFERRESDKLFPVKFFECAGGLHTGTRKLIEEVTAL